MRKIFMLLLFSAAVLLLANPMVPRAIQQFWFDDSGDLMLQFGWESCMFSDHEITISDGVNSINPVLDLPNDEQAYPITINLNALMPDLGVSPESGFLQLQFEGGFSSTEQVSWGPGGDVNLSPLISTQSIYQTGLIDPGGFEYLEFWAKSDHPDMVAEYDSSTRSIITVYTKYQDGTPAANIPLYYQGAWTPWAHSDAEGMIELILPCARTRLQIRHPVTDELVFDEQLYAEPAGCYVYNVVLQAVSNQDAHQEIPAVSLKLSPNVIKPEQKMQLDLGESEAHFDRIRLFDVKGRMVGEYPFTKSWQPPKLNSGVYFLQLVQGDNALDLARFIMLK